MTTTLTGHIIEVPAHLIPNMIDDWGMDDVHASTHDGGKGTLTISGYDFDDDGEISVIRWQTWNGTLTVIPEDMAPDTTLTLWVPEIPQALADELA